MQEDRLAQMLQLRESFMKELATVVPAVLQEWPVDITSKGGQQAVRESVLKGVEEMFEALAHLKNSKAHRLTEVKDFDHEAFLEEYVDALNYFLSVLVMLGVDSEQLYSAYVRKDEIIRDRLKKKY